MFCQKYGFKVRGGLEFIRMSFDASKQMFPPSLISEQYQFPAEALWSFVLVVR